MKKRNAIFIALLFILLIGCNAYTILHYNSLINDKSEQLVEAYRTILDQDDKISELKKVEKEYDVVKQENSSLAISNDELSKKNENLLQTYQEVSAQLENLKKTSEEFQKQLSSMDELMKSYDYVFNYDPVELEECQVYITELEDKLIENGGYDKFESPKRKKVYPNFTIWLEDGSSSKWADQAMEYINKLPKKMIEELNNNGWMFVITPRNLENVYESGVTNTIGLTIYYRSRIYVSNDTYSIGYCTIHEIGHALDFIHSFNSYDSEWKAIYEEEAASSGLTSYFTGSETEYFAQTFQECFLNPDSVLEMAPKSYAYMMRFIDSYR